MAFEKLAEMIFPNVEHDREYYIAKYPKRNLKENRNTYGFRVYSSYGTCNLF